MEGKQFKHTNGNVYTVIAIANEYSTRERQEKYPITVFYMCQNGKLWARSLKDWNKSFTEIKH